jgi:hypothetical protein
MSKRSFKSKRRVARCGAPLGIFPFYDTPGAPPAAFEQTYDDLFVLYDGRRIAVRGKPNTPQAKTWVALEPGAVVLDGPEHGEQGSIRIEFNGVRVH